MTHHVDYDQSQHLLLHTDQEAVARKAAELWVDYDMKRLSEMRSLENRTSDYHAATYGKIGFRYVNTPETKPVFADAKLEERLALLCDQLRARY